MHWYEGTKVIRQAVEQLLPWERESIEELRLRVNQPVTAHGEGWARTLCVCVKEKDCEEYLAQLTGHSLYAAGANMEQGFFTLEDGSRVGFCGRAAGTERMKVADPMFFTVRIARQIKDAALQLIPVITREGKALSTLIVSPPNQGKTTLLRDVIRRLSSGTGCGTHKVVVADERSELCACVNGVPSLDVGENTDVMDGAPKSRALLMLVRTMSPEVAAADELGGAEDAFAVKEAARMGVKVLATAHGKSIEDVRRRQGIEELLKERVFERIVCLRNKRIWKIYDEQERELTGGTDEKYADSAGVSVLYRGRSAGVAAAAKKMPGDREPGCGCAKADA